MVDSVQEIRVFSTTSQEKIPFPCNMACHETFRSGEGGGANITEIIFPSLKYSAPREHVK